MNHNNNNNITRPYLTCVGMHPTCIPKAGDARATNVAATKFSSPTQLSATKQASKHSIANDVAGSQCSVGDLEQQPFYGQQRSKPLLRAEVKKNSEMHWRRATCAWRNRCWGCVCLDRAPWILEDQENPGSSFITADDDDVVADVNVRLHCRSRYCSCVRSRDEVR